MIGKAKKDVKIALNLLYRLGPNFLFRFFTHYGNSSSNKILHISFAFSQHIFRHSNGLSLIFQ
ncbi:hypothetical protein BVU_3030 [Phocaeicola vulgatus ATCC 8482]|uniref:Uncharacterized protein n=1 Tax=Phocaeicola vulgatus (strain ATCC 8482 / DSM 1447 / JCM 5826 / CCUG 4940 / NBRC 14291 / NCTC 11154) TaxID=435590 RepID=A6L4Q4_PHOV8|nr:hypothetical protein BVU_3030 [Phocaeicola vulgatus ATCC 8482]